MRSRTGIAGTIVIIVFVLAIIAVAVLWILSANEDSVIQNNGTVQSGYDDSGSSYKVLLNENSLPDATQQVQTSNESGNTVITLSSSSASVEGDGVTIDGNDIVITKEGTYELSGTLDNGRIIVSAASQNVVLILNGASLNCSYGSAIYVYNASTCTLLLNGDTVNTVSDGTSYDFSQSFCDQVEGEPNAAIFAKDDLIIRGTGSLVVNGDYAAGIICKDTLKIINTNVTVTAVGNGINGKDSLTIQNSTVKVTAGKDALRSTNDTDPSLGYAVFTDSNIYLTSGNDGVQVETGLDISNCSISIFTAEGSNELPTASSKGLKCVQGGINISSGNIVIDSSDDSINAVANINISGGTINLSTADDAIHSDSDILISGGTMSISTCEEGLEAVNVTVSDGYVYINSSSNSINSANDAGTVGDTVISGGYVYISSNGDTIDSKGSIIVSGGTLIINGGDNGGIKYVNAFEISGGLILSTGYAATAQNPSSTLQNCLSASFSTVVSTGSFIRISCGDSEFVFKTSRPVENILFSSDMLSSCEQLTISYGGSYNGGDGIDGVYTEGSYSGGKDIVISVSDGLTIYG